MVACSSMQTKPDIKVTHVDKVLFAEGYSSLAGLPELSRIQNRYAIEQAAKIIAYRNLAKQIYREPLQEQLSVADQVIKDEAYRIYLDLYLREAKTVASQNVADQKKIVLGLSLTPRFYHCLSSTVEVVHQCLQEDDKVPFTRIGYQQSPLTTVNLSCTSDCTDHLSMAGFSNEKHMLDRMMLDYGLYDTEWTVNLTVKALLRYFYIKNHIF